MKGTRQFVRDSAMDTSTRPFLRPSVLIVDDEPDICRTLSDLLEHEGYDVVSAERGKDAIAKIHERLFSAVLLDLGLPDIDGSTVLRSVTDVYPNLPVIVLTACATEEKGAALLQQGAFAFLMKPYNNEQLKATLVRAVGVNTLAAKAERMERAFNDSEYRLQSLMESATDAIILADEDGLMTSWNRSAEHLFGYAEHEILRQSLTLLFPSRYGELFGIGTEQVKDHQGPWQLIGRTTELHGRRKDGSEFPAELCLGLWKGTRDAFYSGFIRDISDRKSAEARVRKSEERLRLALLAGNMGTWDWEIDERRMTWSENVYPLFGVAAQDFSWTYDGFLNLVYPEDRPRVDQAISTAVDTRSSYAIEHRIQRPNGEVGWLGGKGQVLCDDHGRPTRVIGTVHDITERKQAEAKLMRQHIEQQVLMDLIPAMVWYKNDRNEIIRANRLAAESINRTPEQVEGRSTYDLYPDEAEQYYRDDLEVLRSGHPKLGIEELYQTSSGAKRWVRTDKVPYRDSHGQVMGVLVFAQDITERRQAQHALYSSEARFRAFMDHSPVLAFMKDQEGRYIYANRLWELHTNRTQTDWSGKTDEELWPPDVAAMCGESDRQVRERHESVHSIELTHDGEGRQQWWQVIKFPIMGSDGHQYIGGIAHDVTEFQGKGPGSSQATG
ncbi:PAS domain S-box protein [Nitrospira sp. Nam74]